MPLARRSRTILTTKPYGRRRWLLYATLACAVGLLGLEAAARATSRGPQWLNPRYVALSQGFSELDALIEDVYSRGGPIRYFDEFVYAHGEKATRHVNFTSYYSARRTPDSAPLAEAQHIVWAFGGSTMANTETTDSLTIANTWARAFNRTLGPTHVKNFGTGGFFSSYELIKFQKLLREVPASERPTIAIFYDGYNDAEYGFQYGPGSLQKDLSLKLEALVRGHNLKLWTYTSSRMLARHSRLWRRTGARAETGFLFRLPDPRPDAGNLGASVRIYTENVRMIGATCDAFGIRCFFLLQPMLFTKSPLAPPEQEALDWLERHPRYGAEGVDFIRRFYAGAARILADDPRFIDASRILDGREEADFYDPGHVGATTPPVIGQRTAALMLERLGLHCDPDDVCLMARQPDPSFRGSPAAPLSSPRLRSAALAGETSLDDRAATTRIHR